MNVYDFCGAKLILFFDITKSRGFYDPKKLKISKLVENAENNTKSLHERVYDVLTYAKENREGINYKEYKEYPTFLTRSCYGITQKRYCQCHPHDEVPHYNGGDISIVITDYEVYGSGYGKWKV